MSSVSAPDKINVLWFLPTHGESRYLGTSLGARHVDFNYLRQIAQAADDLGYYGVLIPTGRSCEDSWLVAASLISSTQRLKFLVAVRPGVVSPTQAARMTSTLDRLSNGRVLINVVTGGDPQENRGDGIFWDHADRYKATEEFLGVYKRLLAGEPVDYKGEFIEVEDARLVFPPVQQPHPPLYFGGSSEAAHDVASRTVDKYLSWGEPPAEVAKKYADMKERADKAGREVSFGVRLHVIVRETTAKAWEAANELIKYVDDATIAGAQKVFERMDSVGQARMRQLHGGNRDKLEIYPNLWAGVGLVRGGAGTALVGDGDTVAERIDEYRRAGADSFILSGYPHLEEAYSFAEHVLPKLPLNHPVKQASNKVNTGPFGELIADNFAPAKKVSQS